MSDDATLRAKKSVRGAVVVAGLILVGSLLLTIAHKPLGLIDNDTTTRGVMVLIGLMLVVTGNAMPKTQDGPPSQSVGEAATRQSILRVGGWAMLLGGAVWCALWVFAPRDVAQIGSVAAVSAAVVIMVVYAIWRFQAHRRSSAP